MDNNYQQQPVNVQPPYQPQNQPPQKSGLAIASLILGIVSILLGCCYGIGIFTGIIGIVLGIISKKDSDRMSGMAITGIILSVLGMLFGILFWVLFYIGITELGGMGMFWELMDTF